MLTGGFAIDGDADRVMIVDETGAVADGDQIMAILALALKDRGQLHEDTLVATVMSNLGLLNAMTAVSSGATWVSLHHGGGVGMGRSIHAGQVTVADGTELAAAKLLAVLTNDPGMGVIRHVDSGYTRAKEVADERGVRIPMEFKARD